MTLAVKYDRALKLWVVCQYQKQISWQGHLIYYLLWFIIYIYIAHISYISFIYVSNSRSQKCLKISLQVFDD